jgi:hypothetical protein
MHALRTISSIDHTWCLVIVAVGLDDVSFSRCLKISSTPHDVNIFCSVTVIIMPFLAAHDVVDLICDLLSPHELYHLAQTSDALLVSSSASGLHHMTSHASCSKHVGLKHLYDRISVKNHRALSFLSHFADSRPRGENYRWRSPAQLLQFTRHLAIDAITSGMSTKTLCLLLKRTPSLRTLDLSLSSLYVHDCSLFLPNSMGHLSCMRLNITASGRRDAARKIASLQRFVMLRVLILDIQQVPATSTRDIERLVVPAWVLGSLESLSVTAPGNELEWFSDGYYPRLQSLSLMQWDFVHPSSLAIIRGAISHMPMLSTMSVTLHDTEIRDLLHGALFKLNILLVDGMLDDGFTFATAVCAPRILACVKDHIIWSPPYRSQPYDWQRETELFLQFARPETSLVIYIKPDSPYLDVPIPVSSRVSVAFELPPQLRWTTRIHCSFDEWVT